MSDYTTIVRPVEYTLTLIQLESLGSEYLLLMNEIENATSEHLEFAGAKGNLDAFKKTLENFRKNA